MIKMVKKVVSIFVLAVILIFSGLIIYKNGMGIEEHTSRLEEIPIDNELYMLNDGRAMEQIFTTENDYLVGIELIVVNIFDESTGQLVVQLADMWGDPQKEVRLDLNSMPIGEYFRITFDTELDWESNEEYLLRIYAENADISPALVGVYETQDVEENSLCYYGGELIEGRLVVGYIYGHPKYVGYQYWEREKIQSAVVNVGFVLLLGIGIIYVINVIKWNKVKNKIADIRMWYQLAIISFFFSIFILNAIINKVGDNIKIPASAYIWMFGMIIFTGGIFALYYLKQNDRLEGVKTCLLNPCIWIIVLFSCVIRLPMFTQIQKWDGSAYYGSLEAACRNFNFTFQSVWDYFRLASHPTFAYTFFCAIGEFLVPARVTGVLIVQLILTIAALICIYHLLRGYWCHMSRGAAMIIVLLLSIIPIFWGTFSIANIDYFLILFFIFMIYSEYKQFEILKFGWMVSMMLTKETGWVLAAGYILTHLIMLWREGKKESFKVKIRRMGKEPLVRISFLAAIVIFLYAVRLGSLFSWFGVGTEHSFFASWEKIADEGLGINAVGIYPPYIFHKLAQMFVLNFTWIPTIIIIISIIIVIKGKAPYRHRIRNLESCISTLLSFVLFNIFFITAALSRYTIFSAVLIWLMASILTYYIIMPVVSKRVLSKFVVFLSVILCVQNFIYIDPLSNLIFLRLDSGKGKILSTDMNLNGYGDTLINNYRYSYVDKLLDKMLRTIEFDDEMQVIALGDKDSFPINGINVYQLGWDVSKQRRICLNARNEEIIPINVLPLAELEQNEEKATASKAVVYFLKYCEYDEEAYLKRLEAYYKISERKEISNWGGTLAYYVLEKRDIL